MIADLYVPVLTPFESGGEVNVKALIGHAEWVLANGASGIMLFGTTGEGPSVSVVEKIETARAVVDALPGAGVIGSVTENSIIDILACLRGYNELALQGSLVLPPSYFRETESDGLEALFAQVCETSAHPVLAYHIPSLAPPVPPGIVGRLPMWGAKDSSGDLASTEAFLAAGKPVMVGAEDLVPAAIRAGAAGTIAGMANLMPGALAEVCRLARTSSGDPGEPLARVLALRAAILEAAPGVEWIAAMKQLAQQLHGIDLGGVRLPLRARRDYRVAEALLT